MADPKKYTALHINPGLVEYSEGSDTVTVLVKKEALDKMNSSFVGKPVFNFIHKAIDAERAFDFTDEERENLAVGIVSGVGYDVESGYFSADLMIWDDETQENIDENGFNVSCAYIPEAIGGGIYNSVPYDEEVTDGQYHHMAIVDKPRYGDARIFANSLNPENGGVMKFKLIGGKKKKSDPKPKKKVRANSEDEDKKENMGEPGKDEMEMNADSVLVDDEGNEYPVSELVENYRNSQAEGGDDEGKTTVNMDDTMEIDGKEVSMQELYDNMCARKNAEPPTDEPLDEVVDETMKKNSLGDDDGDKKTPNKNFKILKNAANQGEKPEKPKVNTQRTRLERGKNRYGSVVSNTGGAK